MAANALPCKTSRRAALDAEESHGRDGALAHRLALPNYGASGTSGCVASLRVLAASINDLYSMQTYVGIVGGSVARTFVATDGVRLGLVQSQVQLQAGSMRVSVYAPTVPSAAGGASNPAPTTGPYGTLDKDEFVAVVAIASAIVALGVFLAAVRLSDVTRRRREAAAAAAALATAEMADRVRMRGGDGAEPQETDVELEAPQEALPIDDVAAAHGFRCTPQAPRPHPGSIYGDFTAGTAPADTADEEQQSRSSVGGGGSSSVADWDGAEQGSSGSEPGEPGNARGARFSYTAYALGGMGSDSEDSGGDSGEEGSGAREPHPPMPATAVLGRVVAMPSYVLPTYR